MFTEIIFTSRDSIKLYTKKYNNNKYKINSFTYCFSLAMCKIKCYEEEKFGKKSYFDNCEKWFIENNLHEDACILVIIDNRCHQDTRNIIILDNFYYVYLYSKYGNYVCDNKKEIDELGIKIYGLFDDELRANKLFTKPCDSIVCGKSKTYMSSSINFCKYCTLSYPLGYDLMFKRVFINCFGKYYLNSKQFYEDIINNNSKTTFYIQKSHKKKLNKNFSNVLRHLYSFTKSKYNYLPSSINKIVISIRSLDKGISNLPNKISSIETIEKEFKYIKFTKRTKLISLKRLEHLHRKHNKKMMSCYF